MEHLYLQQALEQVQAPTLKDLRGTKEDLYHSKGNTVLSPLL